MMEEGVYTHCTVICTVLTCGSVNVTIRFALNCITK